MSTLSSTPIPNGRRITSRHREVILSPPTIVTVSVFDPFFGIFSRPTCRPLKFFRPMA